jgi:endogenous inhibitor of DNA gyrase (YacG/DUF329 family)
MNPTTPTTTGPTTTGRCPVCGQPFTSTPHQIPRRRYCSARCRKTAWRHRHPGHRSRPRELPPAAARPVPRPDHVPPAVPRPDPVPDPTVARAEPTARCPHCARPVAVITLLVVPAAAHVPTPEVHHD